MAHSATSQPLALITGIAGQDGRYLCDLLLAKGYEVHGTVLGSIGNGDEREAVFVDRATLHNLDLADGTAVNKFVAALEPNEIYNLAAPSVVNASWDNPAQTVHFMTASVTNLLAAILASGNSTRFFQASSAEIYRGSAQSPQTELTTPAPVSPYGASKLFANSIVASYRATHGTHASAGVLYNHESPLRPVSFVTRKIVSAAVAIKQGRSNELVLGNLSAQRDWSFAGDFVQAMWLMLQQEHGDDYILASGQLHTVGDLVKTVFDQLDLEVEKYVRVDDGLLRGNDVALLGDPSKARDRLGWQPRTSFSELIELMVAADLAA